MTICQQALAVLCKINWVLSGTVVTPPVFLETFLTLFDSEASGEISFELNFNFWDFLVLIWFLDKQNGWNFVIVFGYEFNGDNT